MTWPMRPSAATLRPLTGSFRQLASVRRITLEDGPERGLSAIAFSTGGGLDFWALADRAMDIGPLWYKGAPLAWQGPAGFIHPGLIDVEGDSGFGFNRGFSGFLHTCGLDHTRQPVGSYPHHGRLAFRPARLIGAGEDWERAEPALWCESEVTQWRLGYESLRLVRRIEALIGGTELTIRDRVENYAPTPQRTALLYHFNLGFPAIAPGAIVTLNGESVFGPLGEPDPTGKPVVTGFDAVGATASCRIVSAHSVAPDVTLTFATDALPHLQLWHDPRPGTYVLGVEPCTAPRAAAGELASEPTLEPGGRLELSVRVGFGES